MSSPISADQAKSLVYTGVGALGFHYFSKWAPKASVPMTFVASLGVRSVNQDIGEGLVKGMFAHFALDRLASPLTSLRTGIETRDWKLILSGSQYGTIGLTMAYSFVRSLFAPKSSQPERKAIQEFFCLSEAYEDALLEALKAQWRFLKRGHRFLLSDLFDPRSRKGYTKEDIAGLVGVEVNSDNYPQKILTDIPEDVLSLEEMGKYISPDKLKDFRIRYNHASGREVDQAWADELASQEQVASWWVQGPMVGLTVGCCLWALHSDPKTFLKGAAVGLAVRTITDIPFSGELINSRALGWEKGEWVSTALSLFCASSVMWNPLLAGATSATLF